MTRARDLASRSGLIQVIPTGVVKGASGSASVNANGTVTFTGTESIALDGCFSSSYNNYRVITEITSAVATELWFQLRSGGTTDSTSPYNAMGNFTTLTGSTSLINFTGSYMYLGPCGSYGNHSWDITGPFSASKFTGLAGVGVGPLSTTTRGGFITGNCGINKSFDGFRIYPAGGTWTGTVTVYGYNNS
jgi:hypothetical protein